MGKKTGIAWCHHTFNPWWGCTRVSPGCTNCYAEAFSRRTGGDHWGPDKSRVVFGEKHWREPIAWNAAAEKAGERRRVFCASMADVFDVDAPPEAFEQLWKLIPATPALDWLILTKRPERFRAFAEAHPLPRNVWAGTTIEDQPRCDERLYHLAAIDASVRFISGEPQIEHVNPIVTRNNRTGFTAHHSTFEGGTSTTGIGSPALRLAGIGWVICGGESGPKARPFDLAWARWWRDICRDAGAAFFMKQMGTPWARQRGGRSWDHGDHLEDFPEDLRIREFPEVTP